VPGGRAEELEKLRAALEQANAAKDRFIAALSHELRTPLTPVIAATGSLLQDTRLPEDVREDLAMAHRNVGLEVALINDLLDVTRIAAGKLALQKRPLDAVQVLREAARICAPDLQARGQTLSIDGCDAPCLIEADSARLHQVFWNLIKNAIKFTPPRGRITLSVLARDGTVCIGVSDSGIGIEPAAMPKLFSAFEQGDYDQRFGGLGLGLAIARGVATFTVELPLLDKTERQDSPARAATGPAEAAVRQALRILLVEDHADTARIMARLLKRCGHEVTTAPDIRTALSHAGQRGFELLISDLGLPDGSGLDLMRELRHRGWQVPGIALTGYGQEDDLRRTQEAGFAMHLTKPVDFEQLAGTISRMFARVGG
jgi:two-component system CheB/CheR fusion protein